MSYNQGSLEATLTITVSDGIPVATNTTTPAPASTTRPPATTVPSTSTSSITTTTSKAAPPASSSTSTTPFVGLNVYELASDPGVNLGCGASFSGQWASFFSSLPKGTVVRFWATQQMATSAVSPQRLDWTALDAVFDAAAEYHVRLIPVLGNEWTNCDGTNAAQKGLSWFQGGYMSNTDEGPLSYDQWVTAVVSRYANSSATYMWEPLNEAQATSSDGSCSESAAAAALRSFYDVIGGTIHSIDSRAPG